MTELILGIIWGILFHQTERVTRRIPGGWQEMTNYGLGVIGVYPFFDLVCKRVGMGERTRQEARIAYILAFVFFGVGVGSGRIFDALWKDKK